MIMLLMMILGTSWALVQAVSQVSRNTVNEQKITGDSLMLAKQALLGYLAQQALTNDVPGRFPCPESLTSIGGNTEGDEASSCSTLPAIGRLPWKKLGIDKPLDGAGEALWYVVGTSARTAPINFSTTGSLTVDGASNASIALIVAPGRAINSLSSSETPPSPCAKRNQSTGRNVSPLNSSDYLECGNTAAAFTSSRNDSWGNDRVISISSAEMLGAIEGAVADRIQRFVAPILNGSSTTDGWYQNTSLSEWGVKFFPYASSWSDPSTNDSCGNLGITEGLLPLATGNVASGSACSSRWTSGTGSKVSGTGVLTGPTCTTNTTLISCVFTYTRSMVLDLAVTAANIAMGFRTKPASDEITISPSSSHSITSLTGTIVPGTGEGQLNVRLRMATRSGNSPGTVTVTIPHPSDSILLSTNTTSNPDLAWFINNQWQRYTYYAISPAASPNPSGTCTSIDVSNCLTLTNAESGTGNVNDKRLMLVLSGRPLAGKSHPSSSRADYFELQNDQTTTSGDRTFQRGTISTTFNDRPAVCPFERQTTGSANVLCN